jgi:hypothetical protein
MSIHALLAQLLEQESGLAGEPGDYSNLVAWFDADAANVTESSGDVTQWDDVGPSTVALTVPSAQTSPFWSSSVQNSLPGMTFQETGGDIKRKLQSASSIFDNFFSGSGNKSIAFAGRMDDLVNSFTTTNTIASKGFTDSNGWRLRVLANGTMSFSHRRSDGTTWDISAAGFFSEGDLIFGSITYNGGNTSGSGSFRLYNNSTEEFVTAGAVTTGTSGSIGTDATRNLIVGNILDTGSPTNNAPFGGPLFGLWFVKPASTFYDEGYMARWFT